MMESKIKEKVSKITSDKDKDAEERINEVFAVRQEYGSENESEQMERDVFYFTSLISMLLEENETHLYDLQLLQLYTLLAETYIEQNAYRELGPLAYDVLDLVRYEVTPWPVLKETMPRIIDAVGESVYNHFLYELLLHYFRAANREGDITAEMKGHLRKLLKLRLLLDDNYWYDKLFDKELQKAIAGQFTSEELLKIMLRPDIGSLRKDPVEYTTKWEDIYYDLIDELDSRFANVPRHLGFCFQYWSAQKELLTEKYGIEWNSPSQMNPGVMFD